MRKKILAIISILSLLLTLVPGIKTIQAAPGGQIVGFDGISSQAVEGEIRYVKFKPEVTMSPSDYIDVHYTISGTASDSDYYFNDGTGIARIKKDQLSFPLYSVDEGGLENDEKVIITITSATDQSGQAVDLKPFSKVYTHTIWDYNGPPKLSFLYDTASSNENGNPGVFTVYLSRATNANVTFKWGFIGLPFFTATNESTVINGHTFPPDLTTPPTGVFQDAVIPAGQTSISIPLNIQDDNLIEDNETFQLSLGAAATIHNAVAGSVLSQTYTIIDNEGIPTISFQSGNASGSENLTTINTTVVLSEALLSDTTFSLVVDQAHSTAIAGGQDWNLPLAVAPLTIPAGATSANVAFTVVNDNIQEGDETATISITNILNAGVDVSAGQNMSFTYTILDNDTPAPVVPPVVVPPGGGNGGGGGSTLPNNGVCPVLNPGDMIKVAGNPAIYVVNRFNKIMYFPSGDEYKSWNEGEGYGGYITVTQNCFDNGLQVPSGPPAGVNYRSGSYIIQKENTSQLYAVLPNNTIAKISTADAQALYGTNYKVMTVKFIFWSNYINTASEISGKAHSGMLVRKDNKVWYVDGNNLREVPVNQMSVNRFKSVFVHTVPASYLTGFGTGAPIDGEVTSLTNRTQL